MSLSYRQRAALGQVKRRPPRVPDVIRREMRRRYFLRECRQLTLALEYGVSIATVSRIISE